MAQDYYEVLGVQKNADQEAIKKAYRKLAMQFHPDRNPGNKDAEEKFKKCAEAYDILSNPDKRAQYDRFGQAAFANGGQGHPGFQDMGDIFSRFSDIFGDFFGMSQQETGGGRTRARRGADLRYVLEISLKDVLVGTEKQIEFDVEDPCQTCQGTGGEDFQTCTQCRGTGQFVRVQGFFSMATTCPKCHGEGQITKKVCTKCKGKAFLLSKRKLAVKVPAGVDQGTRLRVGGEGEKGLRGGPAGDLYVEIRLQKDSRFQRRGNDLLSSLEISYLQAILGTSKQVETLQGTENVEIAAGTQPGDTAVLRGKGVPSLKGYGRGDLIFQINIKIPKTLSREEEIALREVAQRKSESVNENKGLGSMFKRNPKKGS